MIAKYTEFYAEYIEKGGQTPAAFDLIPALNNVSFTDLFYETFCNRELGFETEAEFAVKFNARADIICPLYSDKILSLAKNDITAGATKKNTSTENGKTKSANNYFRSPDNVTASAVETPLSGSLDSQDRGENDIINHVIENAETSATVDELLKIEDHLYEYKSIYEQLLNELENLLLNVWSIEKEITQ